MKTLFSSIEVQRLLINWPL